MDATEVLSQLERFEAAMRRSGYRKAEASVSIRPSIGYRVELDSHSEVSAFVSPAGVPRTWVWLEGLDFIDLMGKAMDAIDAMPTHPDLLWKEEFSGPLAGPPREIIHAPDVEAGNGARNAA